MVFPEMHGEYQERYATWDEAAEGHARAVNWLRQRLIHRIKKNKKWRSKRDLSSDREMPAYVPTIMGRTLQKEFDMGCVK